MKPVKLFAWGCYDTTGKQLLNPVEQEIRDCCCIVGKTYVQLQDKKFTYRVETTPIMDIWQGVYRGDYGCYILTRNRHIYELVGEPSNDYLRLFHMDRARFAEVVTKKLKLI